MELDNFPETHIRHVAHAQYLSSLVVHREEQTGGVWCGSFYLLNSSIQGLQQEMTMSHSALNNMKTTSIFDLKLCITNYPKTW